MRASLRAGVLQLGMLILIAPAALAADAPVVAAPSDAERQLGQVRAEIERARLAAGGGGREAGEARAEMETLEKLARILAEQRVAEQRAQALAEEADALTEHLAAPPSANVAAAPPYSLRFFDEAAGAAEALRHAVALAETAAGDALALLETARAESKEEARVLRLAREQRSPQPSAQVAGEERRRELAGRLAEARVRLRELDHRNALAALELERKRLQRSDAELAWIREHVDARERDLDEVRTELAQEEFDAARRLELSRLELASAEERLAAAQRRIGAARDPQPAAEEEAAARRLEVARYQRSVAFLGERLERVAADRQLWERRYQLVSDRASRVEVAAWFEETARQLEETTRQIRIRATRVEELRRQSEEIRAKIERASDPRVGHWLGAQSETLGQLIQIYTEDLAGLASHRALEQRLHAELEARRTEVDLSDRIRALFDVARSAWHYEITSSENRAITVGKAVSAVVVFLIGYLFASAVTRIGGRRVFSRVGMDEGAAHAFESLAFYALMVAAFLFALRIVNIPLTAFAVVGGALAIGVGFGSQNVVNNFISGVILLAERPLKLGDLVELGGVYGTIERIGLRSTRVRTGDNIHIIVPNSSFLENNVINWTHNDETVRIVVKVGVVYGSPTRDVERIIREVLDEQTGILKQPAPMILFTNFGDNSLDFEARFWIRMRTHAERLQIESDVRYRIDDRFRDAGIVIAFPQRDVHLDSIAPLEVRLVGESIGARRAAPVGESDR